MPERPLVLFAAPTVADKERRYGGAPKYYFPSHSRQVSRLTPQFNVLQNTMNSGSIYFTIERYLSIKNPVFGLYL